MDWLCCLSVRPLRDRCESIRKGSQRGVPLLIGELIRRNELIWIEMKALNPDWKKDKKLSPAFSRPEFQLLRGIAIEIDYTTILGAPRLHFPNCTLPRPETFSAQWFGTKRSHTPRSVRTNLV